MGDLGLAKMAALLAPGLVAVCLSYGLSLMLARGRFLLDRPTERSNHIGLTSRAGGVAIVAGFSVAAGLSALLDPSTALFALNIVAGAFLAFAVGFADDLVTLPPLWKFAGQIIAAGLFMLLFGPLQSGPLPLLGETALGAAGVVLTFFWIAGFMNAYNFMDGVNGIAASCGAFALTGLAAAAAFFGAQGTGFVAALAAAALIGFLPMNFPKGRLFMGDGGSQAAGFLIAALALAAAIQTEGAVSALFMPTAMAPFLFDVAFTLAHRFRRRRNVLSAHSEHLYQLLVRLGASHVQSTTIFLSLTALSTGAAITMLSLDPALQWIVPASLGLLFVAPALRLYARARSAGLLAATAETDDAATDEDVLHAPVAHAAE